MQWLRRAADDTSNDRSAMLERELMAERATNALLEEEARDLRRRDEAVAGWTLLDGGMSTELTRDGLGQVVTRARMMHLRNPVLQHAVEVQAHYVFGQGIAVQAEHPDVDAVVQTFWDEQSNRSAFTSQESLLKLEVELSVTGNLFYVLFPDHLTGLVRIRTVPFEDVLEVVCNPADNTEVWFYKRRIPGAQAGSPAEYAYYPDRYYSPPLRGRPSEWQRHTIRWSTPMGQVKVGGFPYMRYGLPETYAALDWARALTQFHEDGATVRRAQSRFAARVTVPGGKQGIAAAKSQLGTTRTTGEIEGNPPPVTGATFIDGGAANYNLLKMAGNAPGPDEGRGLTLMVSAGVGIPETILMGNADVGNLATSKTLDRPTELKMAARQALWKSIIGDVLTFVIDWAVRAPKGALTSIAKANLDGSTGQWTITFLPDKAAVVADGEERPLVSRHVNVDFPDLLERDVKARVDAVVAAAPFLGEQSGELLARLMLTALGEDDIDELLTTLFPEKTEDDAPDDTPAAADDDPIPALEAEMMAAARAFREAAAAL